MNMNITTFRIADIATELSKSVPGMSAFLFGAADLPRKRSLVQRRKEVKWYFGKHGSTRDIQHDIGIIPSTRYGLTGNRRYMYKRNKI